ncbi:MauE/DoxX family redox-associated membrane protein [Corynebacterium cystitidis]|uniref:MauE/DoxX family redox-associated membrane protein n=1 Tax=Corynebacterium cystitidis TaxID=35757 RepID=UPI00358DCA44
MLSSASAYGKLMQGKQERLNSIKEYKLFPDEVARYVAHFLPFIEIAPAGALLLPYFRRPEKLVHLFQQHLWDFLPLP